MNAKCDLHVVLVSDRTRIPLSKSQWNSLAAANEVNTVFQTYEWFDCWWNVFGDSGQLAFLAVYQGEQIVGFAALMARKVLPGFAQLQFAGTGNADYQDIVAPAQFKRAVVAAICKFLQECDLAWRRLWLCNIPEHSMTLTYLRSEGGKYGLRLLEEAVEPCPALVLVGEQDATRHRMNKYSLRRPMNWFRNRGAVGYRKLTDWTEIERQLPVFFDQHIKRWAAIGKESLFGQEAQRRFYMALAKESLEAGWLSFSMVEFNEKPLAFHFGFDDGHTMTWYKPSFDVSYARHSPGLLLIRYLVDDALRNDRSEIDFTIGGEPFKERFANRQRRNLYISAYPTEGLWRLAVAVQVARRTLGLAMRVFRRS